MILSQNGYNMPKGHNIRPIYFFDVILTIVDVSFTIVQ